MYHLGMSNLGWYQKIVVLSKRVGGPRNLVIGVFGGGYVVLRSVEAGGKSILNRFKKFRQQSDLGEADPVFYTASVRADCGGGLILEPGDEFSEVARDAESVIISVDGKPDNPYTVSAYLLADVSSYPHERQSK